MNNQGTIAGKIVSSFEFSHRILGEEFYKFYVETVRDSGVPDIIKVIISEKEFDKNQDLNGLYCIVDGKYQSYIKKENEKRHFDLFFYAEKLSMKNEKININKITLYGEIRKSPIYRKTPLGREISDLLLYVNREDSKRKDYIPCIAWGRTARFASKLEAGTKIQITGRIQSREYTKHLSEELSETRTAYEVSINWVEVVENENPN